MQLSVCNLKPKNVGQTVSFAYDPNGQGENDPDRVEITGMLEGYEKSPMEVTLVVAGREYPLTPDESVDMIRSSVLSRLHFIENEYLKMREPDEVDAA